MLDLTHEAIAAATVALESGRLTEAVAVGRQLSQWGRRSRSRAGRGYGLFIEALAAAARGRLRRAAELLPTAITDSGESDPCGLRGWQLAELAAVEAALGRREVGPLLTESLRSPGREPQLVAVAYALACGGRFAAARDRLEGLAGLPALTLRARLGVFVAPTAPLRSPLASLQLAHIEALMAGDTRSMLTVSDGYAALQHWHLAAEAADAAGGTRATARRDELLVECDVGPLPWWASRAGKMAGAGC